MIRPFLFLFLCLFLSPLYAPAQPLEYEVAFSPNGQGLNLIVGAIESSQESILVAAYSFTSKPIATALLDAHKRGVRVQVVADAKGNSGKYTAVTFLANQGVPVRLNSRYAILHDKFMVFDGRHVQTGSFNYSAAAQGKNAENVLLLRNVPELAGKYTAEWGVLWDGGEDLEGKY